MLLTPSSVTNCHTFSDPLPLERDVLYGRPQNALIVLVWYNGAGVYDNVHRLVGQHYSKRRDRS